MKSLSVVFHLTGDYFMVLAIQKVWVCMQSSFSVCSPLASAVGMLGEVPREGLRAPVARLGLKSEHLGFEYWFHHFCFVLRVKV